MIVVDFIGRLGNQLFQYAFAVSTAKKFKTFFLLNPVYADEISNYFTLDFSTKILSSFKYKSLKATLLKYYLPKRKTKTQDGWEDKFSEQDNLHYEGFFQSENYFLAQKEIVLKRFQIKKKYKAAFDTKYKDIFSKNKTLVIHVRRTDYLNFGSEQLGGIGLCLPVSYYENCLSKIENLSDYKIFCISDDPEFVKELFKNRTDINFVAHEMIVDFQFLINADICIIANSSFSWWGAYLNPKKDKIIYAPEFWLGFKINEEYPKNIIPAEFTKVNVY